MFWSPVSLLICFDLIFFFSQRSRAASLTECLQQDIDVSEAVHLQCQWVVCISLSCLLPPFWTGVVRPVLQSQFHCSEVLAVALSFRYRYWLLLCSALPCSRADSLCFCHVWFSHLVMELMPKSVSSDILGDSGGVVNSLDFCPASLKSLGCFYFRCVLSSLW